MSDKGPFPIDGIQRIPCEELAEAGLRPCRGLACDCVHRLVDPNALLRVPDPATARRDATELESEMAVQAALGHKRFCVGWHDHGPAGVEEEWIDWSEAFAMLRRAAAGVGETADADAMPRDMEGLERIAQEFEAEAEHARWNENHQGASDADFRAAIIRRVSSQLYWTQTPVTDADGARAWHLYCETINGIADATGKIDARDNRGAMRAVLGDFLERRATPAGRAPGASE